MGEVVPFVETCVYIGQAVGALILGFVQGIDNNDHNAEIQFTQNMCDQLRATYPSKNIMIVHSNYSSNLVNAQTAHVECPITWPRTQATHASASTLAPSSSRAMAASKTGATMGIKPTMAMETWIVVTPPPPPPPQLPLPVTPKSPDDPSDGVYLVNSLKNGQWTSGGLAYYKQMVSNGGNNGQQPNVYINLKTDGAVTWEGGFQSGVFPDGDRFTSWLGSPSDIAPIENLPQVGRAANRYRSMDAYKDQYRVLYEIDGWLVYTVYYCT
ncbi:hypothetical protein MMC11_001927 [Xylographa trunciseda]|nr:hypothetical protein [Xylographa trunciseda]